jgi:uncharacterized protein
VPAEKSVTKVCGPERAAPNPDVTLRKVPGLNHLFQTAKTGSPSEYATIDETMSPALLDAVTSWINERFVKPVRP